MTTKICSKCGIEKEITYFSKSNRLKGGLSNKCKACTSIYNKLYFHSGMANKKNRRLNLNNRCIKCKNNRLTCSKYCLYHWVYLSVRSWKLPKDKINPTIQGLIKKLDDSEYCCHYSGLKITPGFSASIDHRIPKSKGGSHDLNNLVWCHTQVNKMKSDLSEKEFINRSANILVELNYLDSKGEL